MSQAETLLQSLGRTTARAAGTGEYEEHIVIDRERNIDIPNTINRIGVQFDHNIETVTFDCPRYWDEHDLSTMRIYINYMRADGHIGMHLCDNIVAEDEIMHFDWTISGDVTQVEGYLSFLVCIKQVDEDGNESQHWNSRLNNDMYIAEGLECQETILKLYPDIITQLLNRMDAVEVEQQRWENATEKDLAQWKANMEQTYETWTTDTYKELDDRMKVAEGNTTPEEILNRVHEAIAADETVHQILENTTDEYIQTNEIIAETVMKTDEALSIAKGANLAISYTSYEEMISVLNSLSVETFKAGQNIYIATVGVPDLFVYDVAETSVEYAYVDDQSVIDEMMENVFFRVGHYKLAQLETQNVDIRDVVVPLLVDDWVEDEDGTYSQTVLVEGLGAGNNPVITLYSLAEEISEEEWAAYTLISDINVTQGAITFITVEKPEITFTVIAKSVTAAEGTEVALDGLIKKVDAIETSLTDVVVPLLLSDWVAAEDGTYIQNIHVAGLGTVSAPLIVLSSVNEIASEDELYSYACISDVVVTEGNLKFIASELPKISFTVIAKGVVAAENDVAADITALVGRVSELEGEIDNIHLGGWIEDFNNAPLGWSSGDKITSNNPFPNFWTNVLTVSNNDGAVDYLQQIAISWANGTVNNFAVRVRDAGIWFDWQYFATTNDIQDYLAIKNFRYQTKVNEAIWTMAEHNVLGIPEDCTVVQFRFWYAGTSEPYAGHMTFFKNLPRAHIDTMFYYTADGTRALCSATVDWDNKSIICNNIEIPQQYWNVGITFWK